MENNGDLRFFREHKLFKDLSTDQIKQVGIISELQTIKKGAIINSTKSKEKRIFILKNGHIKLVVIDKKGKESIKNILKKGDLFGELSLETETETDELAKVVSNEVSVFSFRLTDFEELLLENSDLALSYIKFVGFKIKDINDSYLNLISKDAKARLNNFLKDWAENEGRIVGQQVIIKNYLTQKEIGQLICTTRQTTATLFNELVVKGIINYSRKEIIIFDITKLQTNRL
jgi:CRP-like cAMP-binding protein